MIRSGGRVGGGAGGMLGKASTPDDQSNELVPLSLQRLRDLADSLRASMPAEDGADGGANIKSPDRKGRKGRHDKIKRRHAAGDAAQNQALLGMDPLDLQALVGNMHDKYATVCEEHDLLQADASKEQQAYVRREVQYKSQIKRMTELLEKAAVARGGEDVGMPKLRQIHGKIMERLEEMRLTARNTIHEQEQELLRLFRARLFQAEDKHKKAQSKKGAETVGGVPRGWLEKATRLERDLEHYKEESSRLDTENGALTRECKRLQAEHRSHQDDLAYLEKQITVLRKDNLRLKRELEDAAGTSMQAFLSAAGRVSVAARPRVDGDAAESDAPGASEEEEERMAARNREAMVRLRKQIDDERGALRDLRTAHVAALGARTELEKFLTECLSDVKKQVSKRRLELMQAAAQKGSDEHGQMARDERDRVLQLLLSQERVISLLFDKTFPSKSALAAHRRSAAAPGGAPSALASSSQDELSGLVAGLSVVGAADALPDGATLLSDPGWATLSDTEQSSHGAAVARRDEEAAQS